MQSHAQGNPTEPNSSSHLADTAQPLDGFQAALRHEESKWLLINGAILLCAFIATALVNGAIIGTLVWIFGPGEHHVRWITVYLMCIPLTIALFTWFDPLRRSGPPYEDVLGDHGRWKAYERSFPDLRPRYSVSRFWSPEYPVLTQLLYLAPRQLRDTWKIFLARRHLRLVSRQRAARVLHDLLLIDHSASVEQLLHEGEQPETLMPVLAYLTLFGGLGMSSDGQRVWLTTTNVEGAR